MRNASSSHVKALQTESATYTQYIDTLNDYIERETKEADTMLPIQKLIQYVLSLKGLTTAQLSKFGDIETVTKT